MPTGQEYAEELPCLPKVPMLRFEWPALHPYREHRLCHRSMAPTLEVTAMKRHK